MKIELTREEIELVITGLAHAQTMLRLTMDNMSGLETKMQNALNEDDVTETECETVDLNESMPRPKEVFFYDTFNFEVEQEKFDEPIISGDYHLRFINGKQGQLGIESGERGVDKYKPVFISKRDKPFFQSLFRAIRDTGENCLGVQFINSLKNMYDMYDRRYAIKISSTPSETTIAVHEHDGEAKYKIYLSGMFPLSNGPCLLKIHMVDGTKAVIQTDFQLRVLLEFMEYHS